MKVTYIKMFNKQKENESVLMKHLRSEQKVNRIGKHQKTKKDKKFENVKNVIHNTRKGNVKNEENNESYLKNFLRQNFFSKKIIKRNQAVLVATSLMLVTAGYMNYTNNIKKASLGDAQLVSANIAETQNVENNNDEVEEEIAETTISNEENTMETMAQSEEEPSNGLVPNDEETVETSTTNNKEDNEYFTKTKLERDTMYSQMLETYQKILENSSIPNEQKSIASNEIKNINDRKSTIATIENLIKIKGIQDLVVLINDNSINIVVKSKENLETAQVAQIQNIVSRELQANIEDIHITVHE